MSLLLLVGSKGTESNPHQTVSCAYELNYTARFDAEANRFVGLVCGELLPEVVLDGHSMLVKPEVATQQLGEQPGTGGENSRNWTATFRGTNPRNPNFPTEPARASGATAAQAFFRQRAA